MLEGVVEFTVDHGTKERNKKLEFEYEEESARFLKAVIPCAISSLCVPSILALGNLDAFRHVGASVARAWA